MERLDYRFFESLVVPRPVGSENNVCLQTRIVDLGQELGYEVEELTFECVAWTCGESFAEIAGAVENDCAGRTDGETAARLTVCPSPFSPSAEGTGALVFIETIEMLRVAQFEGKVVVLHGEIAAEPLMPKDFPFYQVPEHREIAELLEAGRPLAVLSAMGAHPMCGLDPCPMFEDCHLGVPSAYFPAGQLAILQGCAAGVIAGDDLHALVRIDSERTPAEGKQVVLHKRAGAVNKAPAELTAPADTIIICAHMDTAYGTPGALDNAAGLYVLLKLLEQMKDIDCRYDLQFVPFNGEDYADVSGQRAYLARYTDMERIRLVINVDGIGCCGSKNALSFYNLAETCREQIEQVLDRYPQTEIGEPWYAGDHSMFAMNGVPALAFVSSDLAALTAISHTEQDTAEGVDITLAEEVVPVIIEVLADL